MEAVDVSKPKPEEMGGPPNTKYNQYLRAHYFFSFNEI